MKIYLEKALFVNRAPFDKLELDFNENEIAVLTAVNGRGKSTILSHLVDAFYEIARPYFQSEFEGKEDKLYRISSGAYNLVLHQPSFVYFRFRTLEGFFDYVDIRNNCTEQEYNEAINIENKIPFGQISSILQQQNYTKALSTSFSKQVAEQVFGNNLLTYFPSYRLEVPGYLNDLYKVKTEFRKASGFVGNLKNPIEVITGLPQFANWLMDVVLDMRYTQSNVGVLKNNIDYLISLALASKNYGNLRFGVGRRSMGGSRIQILENKQDGKAIYPNIFNLSSGEAAIICLFGELLRQADNNRENILTSEITGIVLVDEVDKHLHITLQKEVLPVLFSFFPKVQFIVSSHSPFLSMGLAEQALERSKIVDLDNLGISKDPTTNELYLEVYNMMIGENERFKEMYQALERKIRDGTKPLIVTEGKTDVNHLRTARQKLNIEDIDVDYFEPPEGKWGDSKLELLLEQVSKVPQSRKIIGIFDRDVPSYVSDIEKNQQPFKDYGNNVYAFCIPVPSGREEYRNISIEFYYSYDDLRKEKDGKRLYFDNEVEYRQSASNKQERNLVKLETSKTNDEDTKKVFDDSIGGLDWIHSKARFADLVENDQDFSNDFNFENFRLIFDKVKTIIDLQNLTTN